MIYTYKKEFSSKTSKLADNKLLMQDFYQKE